jgi:predicted ester cyclase
MGVRAAGRTVVIEGTEILRVEGEKIVEDWVIWDALGLLRQLGLLPPMSSTL